MSAALFLKDPASARYAAGGLAEAEELFGSPLPDLPAPELDEGREVFLVHVHSRLRLLQQRFLEGQLGQIGALTLRTRRSGAGLRRVRGGARARGHVGARGRPAPGAAQPVLAGAQPRRGRAPARRSSSAASRCARASSRSSRCCSRSTAASTRTAAARAMARAAPPSPRARRSRPRSSTTASPSPRRRRPSSTSGRFLASNKRYRIAPEAFYEIQQVLVREAERRLREGDRGLLARLARHLPLVPREHYLKPQSARADRARARRCRPTCWATPGPPARGSLASPAIKAEVERRRGAEVLDAFLELSVSLRRFELVSHVRDRVESLGAERSLELEEKTRQGLRVYEFGEAAAGAQQRRGRDRAVPRPARLHAHLRGPHLRGRPDARALRASSTTSCRSSSASAARSTSTSAMA